MQRIEKKTWPELFQKMLDGTKKFDLRLGDFDCQPGDILVLKEWDPQKKVYTGRVLEKTITFVKRFSSKDIATLFGSQAQIKKYGILGMSLA